MDIVAPTDNLGNSVRLFLGAFYFGGAKTASDRIIWNFDISAIPSGSVIDSAKITAECTSATNAAGGATISRCTKPTLWEEYEVTWEEYSTGNGWDTNGGDFVTSNPAAVTFNLRNSLGPFDIEGLADQVQDALDDRGSIYSTIIKIDNEDPGDNEYMYFDSREGTTPPVLTVVYTPPAGPATTAELLQPPAIMPPAPPQVISI